MAVVRDSHGDFRWAEPIYEGGPINEGSDNKTSGNKSPMSTNLQLLATPVAQMSSIHSEEGPVVLNLPQKQNPNLTRRRPIFRLEIVFFVSYRTSLSFLSSYLSSSIHLQIVLFCITSPMELDICLT